MTQEQFHRRVEELREQGGLSVEEAIERAAYEVDHPSEMTVAGGRCTLCEADAPELTPWATRERLCWTCVDLQLDMLALALVEAGPFPVTLGVAA